MRIRRKIMLLGDIDVGKTSIIDRLVFGKFDIGSKVTINVDMFRYAIDDAGPAGNQSVDWVIWDTDGKMADSVFKNQYYIAGAAAALIVGDITRRQTMDTMVRLASLCATKLPGRYVAFILNKIDLIEPGVDVDLPPGLATTQNTVDRKSVV